MALISLHHSRVTPSREELEAMFAGEIVTAGALPGFRGFAFTYTTGRIVQVKMVDIEGEDVFLIADDGE
jgi:hypothetical protein